MNEPNEDITEQPLDVPRTTDITNERPRRGVIHPWGKMLLNDVARGPRCECVLITAEKRGGAGTIDGGGDFALRWVTGDRVNARHTPNTQDESLAVDNGYHRTGIAASGITYGLGEYLPNVGKR